MDTYRTFVAIELPRELRAKLIDHVCQLRDKVPDARASWSRDQNLHLTLKFLGNVPLSEISKLSDAISWAVAGIKPFELTVARSGVFPPKGRPNVLWIGMLASYLTTDVVHRDFSQYPKPNTQHPEPPRHLTPGTRHPLFLLHAAIEDACAAAGFPREPRPFHPHLTIARLRKGGGERRLAEVHQSLGFSPEAFSVSEVVVFKSELRREGSKHTPISHHSLHD